MSKETFVHLSQEDSNVVYANGDFECTLARPVDVQDGSQMYIKSVFIDTQELSSDEIIIQEDTPITMTFVYWLFDYQVDQSNKTYTTSGGVPTGCYFVGCKEQLSPLAGYEIVTKAKWALRGEYGSDIGGYNVVFEYLNLNNQPARWTAYLPKTQKSEEELNPGVIAKSGTWNYLTKDNPATYYAGSEYEQYSTGTFTPLEGTYSLLLPAGNYARESIASFISQQLSINNIDPPYQNQPCNNPFLIQHVDVDVFLDMTKGQASFTFNSPLTPERWVGASQLALEYDAGINRMKWTYLHTPIYSSNNLPSIVFNYQSVTSNYFLACAYSGVSFTSLEPASFWQQLGFDTSSLCCSVQMISGTIGACSGLVPQISWQTSKNIITAFPVLSIAVQTNASYYEVPTLSDTLEASTNLTTEIVASAAPRALGTGQNSHFLIEIQANNSILMTSTRNEVNSVLGIVGCFYSFQQFVSGTQLDSLVYQHVGLPTSISTIRVRILDRHHRIIEALGTTNDVYLSIVSPDPTASSSASSTSHHDPTAEDTSEKPPSHHDPTQIAVHE
jgi:hypothetical protein